MSPTTVETPSLTARCSKDNQVGVVVGRVVMGGGMASLADFGSASTANLTDASVGLTTTPDGKATLTVPPAVRGGTIVLHAPVFKRQINATMSAADIASLKGKVLHVDGITLTIASSDETPDDVEIGVAVQGTAAAIADAVLTTGATSHPLTAVRSFSSPSGSGSVLMFGPGGGTPVRLDVKTLEWTLPTAIVRLPSCPSG